MRKFTWPFAIWCMVGGVHNAALACQAWYNPTASVAGIPCVGILGGTQVFNVVLEWTGGNNFVLTGIQEVGLVDPYVVSLKILTAPVPVAIIFGNYQDGCTTAYGRPSFVQTGNNIDIHLKARVPLGGGFACTLALVPFVEAVVLPNILDPPQYTYSVNGVSITPSY